MLVVLDACTIISDYLMRRAAFEIIRRYGHDLKITLAVPEAAFEDVVFHQNDDHGKALASLQKASKDFQKTSIDEITLDHVLETGKNNTQGYRSFLRQRIESMGNVLKPSDGILRHVSERCYARRRPFGERRDAGYKDALVWETVLDLIRTTNEQIHFVTCDADFLDESKTRLHADLLSDLDKLGGCGRIILFKTLSELEDKSLLMQMKRDGELEKVYLMSGNPVFSIPDFLNSHPVKAMLQFTGIDPEECGLPSPCRRVSLRDFDNWKVEPEVEVHSLGESKKLCVFRASADCVVHWREPDPAPDRVITTDEQDRLIAMEYLPDQSVLWGKALRKCRFRMELVIDYEMKRWVSWTDELVECTDPSIVSEST